MKAIVDAQLPPDLCGWLGENGHNAVHVYRLRIVGTTDAAIADYAEANGLYVISKDQDFLLLRHPDRLGLIWLRCGNTTKRALIEWLELRWPEVERLLAAGERMIEVR